MTMLVEAVAGWLVANVLFVVWMTHLSRRGQARRREDRGPLAHRRGGADGITVTRGPGQDQAAA